jgi:hypothetical protein
VEAIKQDLGFGGPLSPSVTPFAALKEAPVVTDAVVKALRGLNEEVPNGLIASLPGRVSCLHTTIAKLDYAKEHDTLIKITGLVLAALLTITIAAIVFVFIAAAVWPPGPALLIVPAMIIAMGIGGVACELLGLRGGGGEALPFVGALSPFFVLYWGFSRVSTHESSVKEQTDMITQEYEVARKFFAETDHSRTLKLIDQEIKSISEARDVIDRQTAAAQDPIRLFRDFEQARKNLSGRLLDFLQAKTTMQRGIAFYRGHAATQP